MNEHELSAVAFPKFDASELAMLDRCPKTKLRRFRCAECESRFVRALARAASLPRRPDLMGFVDAVAPVADHAQIFLAGLAGSEQLRI